MIHRNRYFAFAALLIAGLSEPAPGLTVRIENTNGKITAKVAAATRLTINRSCAQRDVKADDLTITREDGLILIRATPSDNATVDIEVQLPYRLDLQARTTTGAISVEGFLSHAELITGSGDVRLAMPWDATRIAMAATQAPKALQLAESFKFSRREDGTQWQLNDKLSDMKITYGLVEVKAETPGSLVLENIPIPDESPVKLPWQAPAIVDQLLPGKRGKTPSPQVSDPDSSKAKAHGEEDRMPVFTSSVRLVNLSASITNGDGRPIMDLKPEDFEVLEDEVPQKVTFAGSEEVPFNLALLLDLSGSTQRDRAAMKEAAKRFVAITRSHDRVAAYALANNVFHVLSPLTEDHQSLEQVIEAIPDVSGGSPLYDAIVLSYAQEFRQRPSERNAMVVISDGVDNQIQGVGVPSEVGYGKLVRAAEGMNVTIYPIFLDPFTRVPPPAWARRARERMWELAETTGGRLFPAQSLRDLDPVYPQVAEELRSVYTIAYYPQNQNFDGSWRKVQIRVRRAGAKVRARTGYFAR